MQAEWKWAALRVLALAAVCVGLSTMIVLAAQSGRISAWTLAPFFWCAALLAAVMQYARRQSALTRYRSRHRALAGPRPGAQLP